MAPHATAQAPTIQIAERSAVDQVTPESMAGAGLRFVAEVIAKDWNLKGEQVRHLVGVPAKSTFHDLMARARDPGPGSGKVRVGQPILERLSYILGIARALAGIYRHIPGGDARWVNTPNDDPVFGGRPPLDRMMSDNIADLFTVRNYLTHLMG